MIRVVFHILKFFASISKGEIIFQEADATELARILPQANENIEFQKLQAHLNSQGFIVHGEPHVLKSYKASRGQSSTIFSLGQEYKKLNSNETAVLSLKIQFDGSIVTCENAHASVCRQPDQLYCSFEVNSNGEIQTTRPSILLRIQVFLLKQIMAVLCGGIIAMSRILQSLRRSDS